MLNRHSLVLCLPAILLVLTLPGCGSDGPEMATVSGTVTLDGTPVEGAGVVFTPQAGGRAVNASTDASGKFSLEALVGPNVVAVTKTRPVGGGSTAPAGNLAEGESPQDMGEETKLEYIVPMKYGIPTTSGLKVEVARGMDPVALELQSK